MKQEKININEIPAIIWGEQSEQVYLYLHGKGGCKEEAEGFAKIAEKKGYQVISIDLPGFGERKSEIERFNPWDTVPELRIVMNYVKSNWKQVALIANSIGAWFSMLGFMEQSIGKAIFVSPILDMNRLIQNMMMWAGVTQEELQEKETIETSFGETLSWKYYQYAKNHSLKQWKIPTAILYAGGDHLTERDIVEGFVKEHNCTLTVMGEGEHWFHTQEQLEVLYSFFEKTI